MIDPVPLPEQAKFFAQEYVIDFDTARAARVAGYTTAQAVNLLKDFRVDALIREAKRKSSERVNISVDMVLENLRVMTAVSPADYFETIITPLGMTRMTLKPIEEWTASMRIALKSLKQTKEGWSVEVHDKVAVLDRIGKFFGMFVDRVEVDPGSKAMEMIKAGMDPKAAADLYQQTLADGR